MLARTVDFYLKNLLYVVFAFDWETVVGAACIVRCLHNKNGEEMKDKESRLVVELGSNYVDPKYRGQGIAKEFVNQRLCYCNPSVHFPVSVTSNVTIQKFFVENGGVLMNSYPKYQNLCSNIRSCDCSKNRTTHEENCFLKGKDVWMFERFM
jgi:GNAT superfamily N-acetyltransferase